MFDAIESALLVLLVVLLAFVWIVPIAGKWKVYGKLGMPSWYSLVPVYAATSCASGSIAATSARRSSWRT